MYVLVVDRVQWRQMHRHRQVETAALMLLLAASFARARPAWSRLGAPLVVPGARLRSGGRRLLGSSFAQRRRSCVGSTPWGTGAAARPCWGRPWPTSFAPQAAIVELVVLLMAMPRPPSLPQPQQGPYGG